MSGTIEREIVADIKRRLQRGQADYGEFKTDESRDMLQEAYEEALDAAIYLARAIQILKQHAPTAPTPKLQNRLCSGLTERD